MTLLGTLFGFGGRINRSTFWLSALAVTLLASAVMLFSTDAARGASGVGRAPMLLAAVLLVWSGLALKVKRLHDRGKSGFWLLAGLVPVLGWFYLLWEIGLAPSRPKGARFDKDGRKAASYEADQNDWTTPVGGLANAPVASEAHPDSQTDIAPETSYGVIAPPPPVEAPPAVETAAAIPQAPPVEPAAEAPPATRSQIAAYLASVDDDKDAAPTPYPAPAPAPETQAPARATGEPTPDEPAPDPYETGTHLAAHHGEAADRHPAH